MTRLLIPNTTQMPNVLLDVVMPRLSGSALKVLLAIVRQTYGFQRESSKLSFNYLQRLTGLSRDAVNRGIKVLGPLLTVQPGLKNVPTLAGVNAYALNLDLATGELVRITHRSEIQTSQKTGQKPVRNSDSIKPNIKQRRTDFPSIAEKIISRVNELTARAYRADSMAISKNLRARLKAGASEGDCMAVVEDRWAKWSTSEKMREHFNPVTLFREENFERYLTEVQVKKNARTQSARPRGLQEIPLP